MTNDTRNLALTVVGTFALVVIVATHLNHLQNVERATELVAKRAEADREAAFRDACHKLDGRTLFDCPGVCVAEGGVLKVKP